MRETKGSNTGAVGDCLLDRRGVGEILGMTAAAISVALCRNTFPLQPIRIGSRLRWRASAVRDYLDRQSCVEVER